MTDKVAGGGSKKPKKKKKRVVFLVETNEGPRNFVRSENNPSMNVPQQNYLKIIPGNPP